ncbi:MAG: metallophosphoesterase [Tissierellia bacterium]|nr:metallophosphoesterase [Tissierellia bacterium]
MKKINILAIGLIIILLILIFYIFSPRERIDVEEIKLEDQNLPPAFEGFKISQLSDFHNKAYKDEEKIANILRDFDPDIIVITGDLIDSRRPNYKIAYKLIKSIRDIAPIYYVSGNHEARLNYDEIIADLGKLGVTIMDQKAQLIKRGSDQVLLMGLMDPSLVDTFYGDTSSDVISFQLDDEKFKTEDYKILLSHRPEAFDIYKKKNINLVFSGHAHGGQYRPFLLGGLVAPDQGFFPKYTSGFYEEAGTSMLVSRGLGNSILKFRFNNNYHIINLELTR